MKEQQVLLDIFLEAINPRTYKGGGGGGVVATLPKVLLLFS